MISIEQMIEVTLAAKDRILDGWCQNRFYDENGGVCLVGAFYPLTPIDLRVTTPAFDALEQFALSIPEIRAVIRPGDCSPLGRWNDTSGRTKDEVVDLLDKFVAHLKDSL